LQQPGAFTLRTKSWVAPRRERGQRKAALRHSHHPQGQHCHEGHADHGGLGCAGRIEAGEGRDHRQKLRQAGAIIIGKGTLTEYANFIAIGMPTGYSSQLRFQLFEAGGNLAKVGFGFNPFDPRIDPRTTPPLNDGRPVLATPRLQLRSGNRRFRESGDRGRGY
jgi:hypothetical protein